MMQIRKNAQFSSIHVKWIRMNCTQIFYIHDNTPITLVYFWWSTHYDNVFFSERRSARGWLRSKPLRGFWTQNFGWYGGRSPPERFDLNASLRFVMALTANALWKCFWQSFILHWRCQRKRLFWLPLSEDLQRLIAPFRRPTDLHY